MKKARIYPSILITFVLLCACGKSKQQVYDNGVIELGHLMNCNIGSSFESMGFQAEIVALETTEKSMLPHNSHVVYATKSDVFIIGRNRLFRFGTDGKFKNLVGTHGQGPTEYSQIHSVSFNEEDSLVNIYDNSRRILVWSMDGKPVKEVNLDPDGYISMAYAVSDGYWAEERIMTDGKVTYCLTWFDRDGLPTDRKEIFSFTNKNTATYYTAPIVNQISDKQYFYYDAFSCAGYMITDNNVEKTVNLDYGHFGAESDKLNDMAYRDRNRNNLCQVLDFYYDTDRIMLLTVTGLQFRASIINTISGECLFCHDIDNPRKGGGIRIWNGSDLCSWPSCLNDDAMFGLVDTSEIDEDIMKRFNIANDTESNPCLVVIKHQ